MTAAYVLHPENWGWEARDTAGRIVITKAGLRSEREANVDAVRWLQRNGYTGRFSVSVVAHAA